MLIPRIRSLVVSAAPVTEEVLNFFASFDMPIYDLLGQSEGTAPISMNTYIGQKWKVCASISFPFTSSAPAAITCLVWL